MKKIISLLLIGCLLLTLSVSAAQPGIKASVPLNKQSMQTVVGGFASNGWCVLGWTLVGFTIGGVLGGAVFMTAGMTTLC